MSSSVAEADHMEKEESLRLAIAVSLLRAKIQNRESSSSNPRCDAPSATDALRWKQKAKERKKEIIKLREDLKDAESASHCDLFPANASCKCYFFDNLGEFSGRRIGEASEPRFNDVLRRRFLRLARTRGRRKSTRSSQRLPLSEPGDEEEAEHLRISINFLLELSEADSNACNFSSWSHQAVDFILAILKKLISLGRNLESVEESISFMITQLITKMCTPFKRNEVNKESSVGFYVQHLIRKLGSEPYIGQRAIFAISQRISILAENLLFMDPFDESFPEIDECMFILIQLVEFLICDYLIPWAENEAFETVVFEEWIASVVHARKAVAALEERNGLYLLYMDRVTGELAKRVGQVTSFREVEPAILDKILAFPG
ncbi:protein MULTIPOLAR SPINDLE 1 isoform X2 [Eutrema salsugineum]|uniref:protein MULTIPOLAR SPINDLE 1 isoform X2 n=1 Tax=Eutrema salsugineum TaxID=72664 RepID=UPI000CED5184|nr:protein MULTIPOLAR SPINDLE 1 isoform X2 [Eutrema salsugineum]